MEVSMGQKKAEVLEWRDIGRISYKRQVELKKDNKLIVNTCRLSILPLAWPLTSVLLVPLAVLGPQTSQSIRSSYLSTIA